MAILLCLLAAGTPVFGALSPSDSLEMRIRHAAERGAVADELGSAFFAKPGGEVLLLPPNKDLRFAILIYNIDLLPDRAEFSAGLAFRDGRSNQLVAFKTDHVRFFYKQGLTGPVRMQLMSDVLVRLGRAATVQFLGGYNQTWAEFDCKGLNQFGITAVARISNNVLVPVNANQVAIPDSALTSRVQLQVKSWDELLVSVSLQPFQIRGFNGYVFNISKATLDLSADMNVAGMQLPENYRDPGFDNSWEGFYLAEGILQFPRQFSQDSISSSLAFKNLLLDERGFSGNVAGERILGPEKGRIAGWQFGIEKAGIAFYRNCLSKAELSGPLGLPVLPDTQYLQYNALLAFDDKYSFRVSTQTQVSFPALKASKVLLDPGSQIYLEAVRGDITARALLHGRLSIAMAGNANEKLPAVVFTDITFQGLSISNKAPKFGIQYLGIGQNGNQTQQISRFPVSVYSISVSHQNNQTAVTFGLALNLSDNLGCNTRFTIFTELKNERRADRLSFIRVRLEDLSLRAELANISFQGRIAMMQSDPVYGDGFSGSITFGVKMASQKISGSCKAMFGNVRGMRYWYFDASVAADGAGIPLAPAITLNGFLGGAWYKMRALRSNEQPPASTAGISENGRIYVPDENAKLGLRAGVMLKSTAPGAFQGYAVLEMQFNQGGGIENIIIMGTADFFIKPTPLNQAVFVQKSKSMCVLPNPKGWVKHYVPKGGVAAALEMVLDFNQKTYKADMAMYVNVTSSGMGLSGKENNGLAGVVNMYFTPTNWYVWIGNSLQPLAVVAKIPGLYHFNASAYFMAGTQVLPAPALPENIRKAVGHQVSFDRNSELLSKGVGFALGANMRCQIGGGYEAKKLAIYAAGSAESGFDILLQQYPGNVYCQQTGEAPGVNGWFAQGKYYIGASLNLGIKISSSPFNLANVSVGAVLYGQGPNPIFAEGLAGIHINTRIFKYDGNIRLQLGKKCDLAQTKYSDINIITIEEPATGKDISVLVQPRVTFAMTVGKEFRDVNQNRFRLVADLVLRRGSIRVKGSWIMAENGQQATFQSEEPLQAYIAHTIMATVFLEAWNPRFRTWIRTKQNGTDVLEQKNLTFTTGEALRSIPLNNVASSYPLIGQVNLHRDYTDKGFVELKVSQWNNLMLPGTRIVARFSAQDGECRDAVTEIKGKTVHFLIPKTLKMGRVYRFALVRRTATEPLMNVSSGIQQSQVSSKPLSGGLVTSVNNATTANAGNLNGVVKKPSQVSDDVILNYWFRISGYAAPSQKWIDSRVDNVESPPGQKWMELTQLGGEYLQLTEIQEPILTISADMARSTWFRQSVNPAIYGLYYKLPPAVRAQIQWDRDTIGGLIPNTIDDFEQTGIENVVLKQSHFSSGKYSFEQTLLKFRYSGLQTIAADLKALKQGLNELSMAMDIATLEKIISVMPKPTINGITDKAVSFTQAPVLASQFQFNTTVLPLIVQSNSRQVLLRNTLLLSLSNLTIPDAQSGMVVPLIGKYRIGSMPATTFTVGKGGVL